MKSRYVNKYGLLAFQKVNEERRDLWFSYNRCSSAARRINGNTLKNFKEKWDPEAALYPRLLQVAFGLERIMGGSHTVEGDLNILMQKKL